MTSNQVAAQANKISEKKLAQEKELELSKQKETAAHNRAMEHYAGEEIKAGVVKAGVGALSNVATSFIKSGGSSSDSGKTNKSQPDTNKGNSNKNKGNKNKSKNDLSWTSRFPELSKALGSLPLSVPYGNSNELKGFMYSEDYDSASIPACAIMTYTPVLGKTDTDVVELISAQMYTWLRSVNSGSKNYERSDLILYLMGGAQIVSLFSFTAKIIALSNTFERDNRISGEIVLKSILSAMGVSRVSDINNFISDLRNNKLNYIARLNVLAKRFNSFFLPAVFPVIQRWMWMAGFVGKDQSENNYTTYYTTVPTLTYKFTTEDPLGGVDTSGKLKPIILREFQTLSGILDVLEDCIQSYFIYEDMAIIAGDIHKAFGDTDKNYVRIDSLSDEVFIIPYCSKEDMIEFMNATFVGSLVDDEGSDYYIYQNEVSHSLQQEGKYSDRFGALHAGFNGLLFRPLTDGIQGNQVVKLITGHKIILNDSGVGETPDHLIKYTNLQCDRAEALRWDSDEEVYFVLVEQFKTEIMNEFIMYTYDSTENNLRLQDTIHDFRSFDDDVTVMETLNMLPYFKWAPVVRLCSNGLLHKGFIYIDYVNHPLFKHYNIPHSTWTNIATVSLMSLYGFDVFGTAYRYQGKYDVSK